MKNCHSAGKRFIVSDQNGETQRSHSEARKQLQGGDRLP